MGVNDLFAHRLAMMEHKRQTHCLLHPWLCEG